jgi:hypothetical protein
VGETGYDRRYAAPLRANLPRAAFTKRLSAPLAVISRAMAEYNVAAGVLPPGEIQYPFVAIASIIFVQDVGWPVSPSTLAAASSALTFLALPSSAVNFGG